MARIFITGSADGLGQMAAASLISQGHAVVLHARNERRGREALDKVPGGEDVITGDLASIDETKEMASKVNALGRFDAIIHNAAVYEDPGETILAVNTLAPYILTVLIEKPKRLIYMSSGMHKGGQPRLDSFTSNPSSITYSDSKLHILMLCKAAARRWPDVFANALDPGWVPTKMGGENAPDDLEKGFETQVWLATSDDEAATVSGRYFHHKKEAPYAPQADDIDLQEKLLLICSEITGIAFE
jgi:NAD(P)-dependent dehydrogenase (short-subunit alcohol dehydrogenase family)